MVVAAIKSLALGLSGVLRGSSCRVSFLAFSMICLQSAKTAKRLVRVPMIITDLLQNGAGIRLPVPR